MTNISYYPRESWRPGNEALHVTTSASPAEALSHVSALGMALYGATGTLEIETYPATEGVVFEGNLTTIDKNRNRLLYLAPEIAVRALNACKYGASNAGGVPHLTRLVSQFGRPLPDNDSFQKRIKASVGPFAQETTWDGCFEHVYSQPYEAPLDYEVTSILQGLRFPQQQGEDATRKSIPIPNEWLQTLKGLSELDNLSVQKEILAAIQYYQHVRLDDPDLTLKVNAHRSVMRNKSFQSNPPKRIAPKQETAE